MMAIVGHAPRVTEVAGAAEVARRPTTVAYPLPPTATVSGDYRLTVNSIPVAVERFKDVHCARFAFDGQADVVVAANGAISQWSSSPKRHSISATVKGTDLAFSISQPRQLVLRINDLDRLFIFADRLEAEPPGLGEPGVVNILDSGVDHTGITKETAKIQAAIDALPAGGILYFPAGVYLTGAFTLKSDMTLYLAPGSLIQGTDNVGDYPPQPNDGPRSPPRMVLIDRAKNTTIKGRGIIDANGAVLRNRHDHRGRVLLIRNSSRVLVEDVVLRDPPSWNTHILGSHDVTIRNVKLVNDVTVANTDGFDPDASQHVLIENCFAYCGDDNVSIKCAGYDGIYGDVEDIVTRNCVFLTRKSALKVGTESRTASMKDITFEGNDVLMCDRGMALYCNDGATYSNIRYLDNRFESFYADLKQRVLDFSITERGGKGRIQNVLIRNCRADVRWPNHSSFKGLDREHLVSDVRFENFMLGGLPCNNAAQAELDVLQHTETITFHAGAIPSRSETTAPKTEARAPRSLDSHPLVR
jgi:hypothetical protein